MKKRKQGKGRTENKGSTNENEIRGKKDMICKGRKVRQESVGD